ncbi:unnamed protein product [Urochloa humidicola]
MLRVLWGDVGAVEDMEQYGLKHKAELSSLLAVIHKTDDVYFILEAHAEKQRRSAGGREHQQPGGWCGCFVIRDVNEEKTVFLCVSLQVATPLVAALCFLRR